ncbi:MAG: hypothetical protein A2W90_03915 [Bacteroidetes bacterium GWF2_42_66]|nr:MAG: hypothetical protein A2W89_21940 [Bacteroidetes bacterium GWE2_42_39]OFY41374.1 MAG: hypothetical protein A2W90_03915 [Bacteroidetes bacterium GWF2_42_66]HBL75426.1 hypothetical protein [Prolixibacteraceae bacterium]HCU60665.1 hypothetical protein [Prolixibacteraceae bacterium]
MKTKVTLMLASLLILGACSTGTYVTRTYEDDIYFTPGDITLPPVSGYSENRTQGQPQTDNAATIDNQQLIISQSETYQDGSKGLNNYIFQDNEQGDYLRADMDALDEFDLVASDTTVVGDEEDYQYIINNYYEMDDLGYSYRINRFHRPYFYGSFGWNYGYWDDWYSPYSSWGYGGWGYSPFYSGMYWNSWYSPYYYGSWGWPYYGGYYSPYYSGNYWGGYYGGGYHGGGYYNSDDYHYGQRRGSYSTVADGRSGSYSSTISRSRDTGLKSGSTEGREYSSAREGLTSRRDRSVNGNPQETKSATLTEKRRAVDANSNQRNISTGRTSERTGSQALESISGNRSNSTVIRNNEPSTTSRTYRSGTTTQQRTYVPSYNKPRTVTRSTYNSNSYNRSNSNSDQAPTVNSRSSSNYSKPQSNSSGSVKSTYQSGSSYNRGSSSSPSRSSNSSYNRSSNSYSQPRSSGSSSYNSGSSRSYSSGSSGSSSSGSSGSSSGGGGGGSRSGSSSGRR